MISYNDTSFTAKYTYPKTHPLVKGHFPNNPIMMGVMQWLSIEDCLCHYLEILNVSGNHIYSCNVSIYNQDKIKIADIKSISLESWINIDTIINQTKIKTTSKIVFRNMVKPADTLFILASDIQKR